MAGLIELFAIGFLGLSVIYLLVSVYSRSVRRERLEKEFDAGGIAGQRDEYIARGMQDYQQGLRPKLIGLVYVVPLVIIAITAYLVNAQ